MNIISVKWLLLQLLMALRVGLLGLMLILLSYHRVRFYKISSSCLALTEIETTFMVMFSAMVPDGVKIHRVGYFLTEGVKVRALGAKSVFEFANVVGKDQVYQATNYSLTGGLFDRELQSIPSKRLPNPRPIPGWFPE